LTDLDECINFFLTDFDECQSSSLVNNSHSLQYLDWRELGVEGGVVSRLRPWGISGCSR